MDNELVGKSITLEYKQEQRTIFISETTLYDNHMHTQLKMNCPIETKKKTNCLNESVHNIIMQHCGLLLQLEQNWVSLFSNSITNLCGFRFGVVSWCEGLSQPQDEGGTPVCMYEASPDGTDANY